MTLDRPVEQLLHEAADWRMLSLLFECPSAEWHDRVAQLAPETSDPDLRAAAEQSREQASEGLYHSTFGPGGPAPPREATHRDTLQLGYLMSELEAFYGSFGYVAPAAEPPDHVSVEASFAGYLKLKEAYALSCGDTEAAATARQAYAEFAAEHLASIAGPLEGMLAASGVPYLEAAGRALARRTGPAKQRFLVLGAESLGQDEDNFGCGEAAAVEQEEQFL